MKRRTLDIAFSIGGLCLAVLLVILGLVLTNRANFAKDYVRDQLTAEDVVFKKTADMDARETAFTQARSGCAIKYAGQVVTTGKQAECYANEVIGAHLTYLATRTNLPSVAYVDGMTYRELGVEQRNLNDQIAKAKSANDSASVTKLEQQLKDVGTVRTKVFEGSMLRNALLTSYGFGSLGTTADNAATVLFIAAALLLVLSAAGAVHLLVAPKTAAEDARGRRKVKGVATA